MRKAVFIVATTACLGSAIITAQEPIWVTHGPILGRPGADHVGVWVRTSRPGTFQVQYGTRAGRLDQLSSPLQTRIERDNTGWVLIRGLRADTRYHYRIVLPYRGALDPGPEGSFRTLPDADDFRNPQHNPRGLFNFRFEFGCGNSQRSGRPDLPGFKTMLNHLKDQVHFAIQNGDWMYEERRDYPPEQWLHQVGRAGGELPGHVRHIPTIVGVWENYKLYLERGKNLADWHRFVPSVFTFDDHEILNDVYGLGTVGLRSRRAVFRDIGVRAFYDYLGWSNPVEHTQDIHFGQARLEAGSDELSDQEADFSQINLEQAGNLHVHWGGPTAGVSNARLDRIGGDPNAGVYEIVEKLGSDRLRIRPAAKATGTASYSIGRLSYYRMRVSNSDFFFLDTRTHREMHDINRPDKPGLTMIGSRQKQWLKEGMRNSDADFFFVVSSVNMMIPHISCEGGNKDDAWTVFLEEREELIRFWDSLNKPVFVLTGDLHNSFAIKVTDRVWEFASAPHNSSNHQACDEGNRLANGPFDSRGRRCEIRWSSYYLTDRPRGYLKYPMYCVVQINNVTNSPPRTGGDRWVAFPQPQVIFQYYDGLSGEHRYSEAILAAAQN